jgi:hypothetical protein
MDELYQDTASGATTIPGGGKAWLLLSHGFADRQTAFSRIVY